jgi:hypothetical protein
LSFTPAARRAQALQGALDLGDHSGCHATVAGRRLELVMSEQRPAAWSIGISRSMSAISFMGPRAASWSGMSRSVTAAGHAAQEPFARVEKPVIRYGRVFALAAPLGRRGLLPRRGQHGGGAV